MSEITELKFTSKPNAIQNYLQFLFYKRSGLKPGQNLPEIKASMTNVSVDTDHLKRYIAICGIKEKETVPVLYPHVLASPLYMAVLSHKAFPFTLIGSLHLRNHIVQYRAISHKDVFDIFVKLQQKRVVKHGLEFDFIIELNRKGEVLWKSLSTMMKKGNFGSDFTEFPLADLMEPVPDGPAYRELYIPKYMGKKFARITSDYNPIHLSRFAAHLFGFKRDIVHGMWASAQALGVIPVKSDKFPVRVDLAFKGPLFLDSASRLNLKKISKGYRFDYYCADNPRPSIQGKVTSVSLKEKI